MTKVYLHTMGCKYVVREMAKSSLDDWYDVGVNRWGMRQQYSISPTVKKPAELRLANGMPISISHALKLVNFDASQNMKKISNA